MQAAIQYNAAPARRRFFYRQFQRNRVYSIVREFPEHSADSPPSAQR